MQFDCGLARNAQQRAVKQRLGRTWLHITVDESVAVHVLESLFSSLGHP
jgi:hypothetical protein